MPTKLTTTTGNRSLDEDLRRLYSYITALQEGAKILPTTPTELTPIEPLPGIFPANTVTDVESSDVVGILTSYAREDHAHKGVHSISVNGGAEQFGDVSLTSGTTNPPFNAGTAGASLAINFANGIYQYFQLQATVTTAITFSNMAPGTLYILEAIQPVSGSALITWPGSVEFGSISSSLNTSQQADLFEFYFNANGHFACVAHNSGYNW